VDSQSNRNYRNIPHSCNSSVHSLAQGQTDFRLLIHLLLMGCMGCIHFLEQVNLARSHSRVDQALGEAVQPHSCGTRASVSLAGVNHRGCCPLSSSRKYFWIILLQFCFNRKVKSV